MSEVHHAAAGGKGAGVGPAADSATRSADGAQGSPGEVVLIRISCL